LANITVTTLTKISDRPTIIFTCVSTLTRDINIAIMSVRLYVRLSVIFRYSIENDLAYVIVSSPHDGTIILVL